jgi:hypothetical protein
MVGGAKPDAPVKKKGALLTSYKKGSSHPGERMSEKKNIFRGATDVKPAWQDTKSSFENNGETYIPFLD